MAPLTATDRARFTAAQLVQIDKFPATRLDKDRRSEMTQAAYKSMVLGKWAQKSADQLRAMVCFAKVSGGAITWSAESDLTDVEKTAVQDLLPSGTKAIDVIVDVIGGKRSVEQRLTALEL